MSKQQSMHALLFAACMGVPLSAGGDQPPSPSGDTGADVAPKEILRIEGKTHLGAVLALSSDGSLLAKSDFSRFLSVLETRSGKEIMRLDTTPYRAAHLAFPADAKTVVGFVRRPNDQVIKVWEISSGKELSSVPCRQAELATLYFDSRFLAFAHEGVVKLHDATTGKFIREFAGNPVSRTDPRENAVIALSPDAKVLATAEGGRNGALRLWNTETGKKIAELAGHGDRILHVRFSPSGSRVASACQDYYVRIWDAKTGDLIHKVPFGGGGPLRLAYSPDGKWLAVGPSARHKGVSVLDADAGKKVFSLERPSQQTFTNNLIFSAQNNMLAAASNEFVQVWEFPAAAVPPTKTEK